MFRAYKTEIKLTQDQIVKIHQTIGVCRYLYNLYIATNQERHKQCLLFMSGMDFDKWVNNVHSKIPGFEWIKDVSSKARKKSIMNAETAYKKFFKKLGKFPRFKKKRNQDVKVYFPKNNDTDWTIDRHRIKIPTLGWIRLKEFGYMPTKSVVKSGTVSCKAGRYYVSVLVEEQAISNQDKVYSQGIGIDLGIKDFAVVSNGQVFKNINKTHRVRKLTKQLKREQRRLSRKYYRRKQKGGTAANIDKQSLKVQKLHQRLANIRKDYVNKTVSTLVKTKPEYIVVENLNVRGMMKNRHLSKAVQQQKFYDFRIVLEQKCKGQGIELRIVDRFFPSSKMCSKCKMLKEDLKLSERTYRCTCGSIMDRDLNAALNLENAKKYKIV